MHAPNPMSSRPLGSLLTVFTLLLQVLAILEGAKGVVVCVEQGGQVKIEDYGEAERCRESSAGLAPVAATASPTCQDTPLFGAAFEQTRQPARGDDVAVAMPFATVLPAAPLPAIRVTWIAAPPPSSGIILRNVVLLI